MLQRQNPALVTPGRSGNSRGTESPDNTNSPSYVQGLHAWGVVRLLDWRPLESGTLRGFARVKIVPLGLTLDGVCLHERDGKRWATLPARPQVNKDGELIRKPTGKPEYAAMVWLTPEAAKRFSVAVARAVANHLNLSDKKE